MIACIVDIVYSARDRNGNCYWAFTHTDTITGASVSGTVCGGESNIRHAFTDAHVSVSKLPIREFNRLTKHWPPAGYTGAQLRSFVASYVDTRNPN
jgi:hypothetical protein